VNALDLELEVNGLVRTVQVRHDNGRFDILLDGVVRHVDAVPTGPGRWSLVLPDGSSHEIAVDSGRDGVAIVVIDGSAVPVTIRDPRRRRRHVRGAGAGDGPVRITAPMPGKVVKVLAPAGAAVTARQGVIVVEAMKMENELRAPREGTVADVAVREGDLVEAGALLLTIG
jgi:biotin carboxyl carrier protein